MNDQPCECGADLRQVAENANHCWIHHVDEPITEETYRVCGECFHVWTADELVSVDLALRQALGDSEPVLPATPEDIWCCPECIHDF